MLFVLSQNNFAILIILESKTGLTTLVIALSNKDVFIAACNLTIWEVSQMIRR